MTEVREPELSPHPEPQRQWGLAVLAIGLVGAVLARPLLAGALRDPAVAAFSTVFVAVVVQALPFLVLGVTVSAAIAAFVPSSVLTRALPARPVLAVPVAAVAGVALPGCECGSVPIARRLVSRGVTPAAALTFMLCAPAINPVVLIATAVAFPGQPLVVLARLLASLLAAISVGLIWTAIGRADLIRVPRRPDPPPGRAWSAFAVAARHDMLEAGGFLVIGAAAAATLQTVVPRSVIEAFAGNLWLSILALAVLAVVLALCSEADAFVAAGLREFSLTARLVFLVVGPMVDVKLIALQTGAFGRAFVLRFAPLTFGCAALSGTLVGLWLL